MANFLPGLYTCVAILALLSFITIGQEMHRSDPAIDIQNVTRTNEVLWANASAQIMAKQPSSVNQSIFERRFYNVVYRLVDTGGYVAVEVANTGIEYGFKNPTFDAKEASNWLLVLIGLSIATILFVPVCAVFYLIYLGVKRLADVVVSWSNQK